MTGMEFHYKVKSLRKSYRRGLMTFEEYQAGLNELRSILARRLADI